MVTGSKTKWKYCWSCGANFYHGSKGCKWRKDGHRMDATFTDTKGGSTNKFNYTQVKKLLKPDS